VNVIAKPLAGCRVLNTRARRQADGLSQPLRALGARVLEVPTIEVRPPRSWRALDSALLSHDYYDWLILTSVNGVEALLARLKHHRIAPRALQHLDVCAIGPATRRAVEAAGLRVRVMPREYVAEAVVQALEQRVMGKRVLLVRARIARDVIPAALRKVCAHVAVVEAYETIMPADSPARIQRLLREPRLRPALITFTSSSTARNFAAALRGRHDLLRGVALASIGPVTSATLRELGFSPSIEAREYSMPGLVAAIRHHFSGK
jgi:uroporphyrinogen-III synthase